MVQKDVTEIKEMLVGIMELSLLMAEVFKNGIQISDFFTIMMKMQSDPRFSKAFEGLKEVKAEARDLDLEEGIELLMLVAPYVPKLVDAMVKK